MQFAITAARGGTWPENVERVDPYRETILVNGRDIEFEIDTGAGMTVLKEEAYRNIGGGILSQQRSNCIPTAETEWAFWVKMHVQVSYKGQTQRLQIGQPEMEALLL